MTFPLTRRYKTITQPAGATADLLTLVDAVFEAETLSSVLYYPQGAVTGAATNNRAFTLYNRQTGAGTVAMATLSLVSGTNLSDNVPKALTLSTVSGALLMAAGDLLEWESLHVLTGLADPGGQVQVNTTRTLS